MTRAIVTSLALVVLAGCLGTETGNPPFAPSVGGDTGAPMGIAPQLSVERGWLAIEALELVPGEACEGGEAGTVVRAAPLALELEGDQRAETDPVLREGDYCALRFARTAWTGAEPAALTGLTLALDGSLRGGTPVRVRSARAGTITLRAESSFPMSPETGPLLLFLDESLLFNGVAFASAEIEPDGSILVSAERNAALLDLIEAQLPGALFLYRDEDGDGRLSMEEQAAGALATFVP